MASSSSSQNLQESNYSLVPHSYCTRNSDFFPYDITDNMAALPSPKDHGASNDPHDISTLASFRPEFSFHPQISYTINRRQWQGNDLSMEPSFDSTQTTYCDPGTPTSAQSHIIPSMSVNVSMCMNLGIQQSRYGPRQPSNEAFPDYPLSPHSSVPYPSLDNSWIGPYSHPVPGYSYHGSNDQNTREVVMATSAERNKLSERSHFYTNTIVSAQEQIQSRAHSLTTENTYHSSQFYTNPPDTAKINLCRVCGKTYARPSTLKTHMRTHSGERPYKCQSCNKAFSQAANLTAHLRTHSGEKPYKCSVCDRRFSQSSSVTTHIRTHSGERPYRCRFCRKAFSDSSTLTKHLRIHSGEKPYQCRLCLLRFSQSGNLNRHMKVHANASNRLDR